VAEIGKIAFLSITDARRCADSTSGWLRRQCNACGVPLAPVE
jgi:hypothetical protein